MKKTRLQYSGFTLVELLVVISVIGLLGGMFLVAFRGAQQESNNAKTISTITKISEVLNARMEEYASYPVTYSYITYGSSPTRFSPPIPGNVTSVSNGESTTKLLERARLLGLRDIIRTEMPDHPDDIKWTMSWMTRLGFSTPSMVVVDPIREVCTGVGNAFGVVNVKTAHTARSIRLMQRLSQVSGGGGYSPIPNWEATNANAELLFLIVEDSSLNGSSAIELFGKSEIGDKDGDGLSEFLDADGNPIQWIRWPAGYQGVAAFHPDLLDPNLTPSNIASDPLDRMGADPGNSPNAPAGSPGNDNRPKAGMFPLVVARGNDGVFGLRFQLDDAVAANNLYGSYSVGDCPAWNGFYGPDALSQFYALQFTDPWYPRTDPSLRLGGVLNAKAAGDDLTNYDGNGASL